MLACERGVQSRQWSTVAILVASPRSLLSRSRLLCPEFRLAFALKISGKETDAFTPGRAVSLSMLSVRVDQVCSGKE